MLSVVLDTPVINYIINSADIVEGILCMSLIFQRERHYHEFPLSYQKKIAEYYSSTWSKRTKHIEQ